MVIDTIYGCCCEIAAGVCDHCFVNCKERESNNINACVSSLLCIRDSFRSKTLQTRNMPLSLKFYIAIRKSMQFSQRNSLNHKTNIHTHTPELAPGTTCYHKQCRCLDFKLSFTIITVLFPGVSYCMGCDRDAFASPPPSRSCMAL